MRNYRLLFPGNSELLNFYCRAANRAPEIEVVSYILDMIQDRSEVAGYRDFRNRKNNLSILDP